MKICRAGNGFLTTRVLLTLPGALLVAVQLVAVQALAAGGPWESVDAISRTALDYAHSKFVRGGVEVEATVKSLDPHLKMARCDQPLQAFLPGGQTSPRQNVVVGVRCRGSSPWKIYVPVQMSIRRAVLVARHPLARGGVISAADVRIEKREITALRSAYLTDARGLAGKVLKRSVSEGGLITVDLLMEQDVVKRGQQVTLLVNQDGFSVRMAGVALGDAAINERVRVENSSSRRTVEGVVRSPQLVEVITY